MRYLCIDTSTGASVAIVDGTSRGCRVRCEVHTDSAHDHAEQLTPLINLCAHEAGCDSLDSAGIDAVIVGRGPAPFTGLRAGLVTAKTMAHALDVPVYGVCSLDIAAYEVFLPHMDHGMIKCCIKKTKHGEHPVIMVVTDAKRHEVYTAIYSTDGQSVTTEREPAVMTPQEAIKLADEGLVTLAVGPGVKLYQDLFDETSMHAEDIPFRAAALATIVRLNGTEDYQSTEPLYLRRPDIHGVPQG